MTLWITGRSKATAWLLLAPMKLCVHPKVLSLD
jgi:hypothetical protein